MRYRSLLLMLFITLLVYQAMILEKKNYCKCHAFTTGDKKRRLINWPYSAVPVRSAFHESGTGGAAAMINQHSFYKAGNNTRFYLGPCYDSSEGNSLATYHQPTCRLHSHWDKAVGRRKRPMFSFWTGKQFFWKATCMKLLAINGTAINSTWLRCR